MGRHARRLCPTLLIAGLLATACGCGGLSQNPNYFPHLSCDGDIIRTHAKPKGSGYFSDFDPHACRLEVRPVEDTNPVLTQHVLIATIYDDKGVPRRNRRVEWILEGVGNIIEVDESGFFPGRGYKVDNKYAVSYTDYYEHVITRGNDNPNDDFVIRPGQSWCVVSSPVEGDTHVTVYAPEIYNWDHHKVVVTKHWVDAAWALPVPAVNRAGTRHVFTTTVFRHTDRQPVANYRVRYRILDGPPAVLLDPKDPPPAILAAGSRQVFEAVTDLSGNANVAIVQVAAQQGVNRVGVEIIRPPDAHSASGPGIIVGRGETTKEWQAPSVALTKTAPPSVPISQEVPYTITVTNTGKVETQPMTVRDPIPEGLQYVRSDPPATIEASQLTWTLSSLPAGGAHTVQVIFRSTRVGPVTNVANVTTVDGLRAENAATTQITSAQLSVTKTGPTTGVIGAPVTYQITVTNPGSAPATNVLLQDTFDPGLEHAVGINRVELPVGTLAPGESKTVTLNLTPKQVGRLVNRVNAVADGNLTAHAEHAIDVQRAQLAVRKTGPGASYVDNPVTWTIRVSNPGEVPLGNVIVRDQLPPELGFLTAGQGGQASGNQVTWNVGTLQPREEKTVELITRCLTLTRQAVNSVMVTADPNLQAQDQASIEIRGLPAFHMEVIDIGDPVEVGGKVTYKITVENQGSLPGNQVQITAMVPQQMAIRNANGPSQPRVEGQRVIFPPVDGLQAKQVWTYSIEVEALTAGDVRFRAELTAATLSTPVIREEATRIFNHPPGTGLPAPGGPPAAPLAPGGGVPPAAPLPPPSAGMGAVPGRPAAASGAPAPPPSGNFTVPKIPGF